MKTIVQVLVVLLALSPFFLLSGLLGLLRKSAKQRQPSEDGASLVFFVAPGMKVLLQSVTLALVLFTVLVVWTSRLKEGGLIAMLIPLSVLVAIVLAKPRPVTLDHDGLRQPRWIRGDRQIRWGDVESVVLVQHTGTVYIRSREGGRPISFSPLLVGQARFRQEVRAHAPQCQDFEGE